MFTLLSPSDTGVKFKNLIEESEEFNVFEYNYLYNGGGVSVGDLNNDSFQIYILWRTWWVVNDISTKGYSNMKKLRKKLEFLLLEFGIRVPLWQMFGTRVKYGRYDANKRTLLLGKEKGMLQAVNQKESGLNLNGEVRDINSISQQRDLTDFLL